MQKSKIIRFPNSCATAYPSCSPPMTRPCFTPRCTKSTRTPRAWVCRRTSWPASSKCDSDTLFVGRQKGVFESHFDDAGQLGLLPNHSRGGRVLFLPRGVKHGRVIGGESHGDGVAQGV